MPARRTLLTGRLPLLLGLLALLAAAALWVNAGALRQWQYRSMPAAKLAEEARRRPEDTALVRTAAHRLLDEGRTAEAAALLAPYLERGAPEVPLLVAGARAAVQAADLKRAAALVDRASDVAPEDPDVAWVTAEFLAKTGHPERARDLLLEVTRARPDHAPAWTRLGELALNEGDLPAALERLDRAERLRPTAETAQLRAVTLWKLGRLDEAEATARTALERRPTPEAWAVLGEIVQLRPEEPRLREAQGYLKKALELDPGSTRVMKLLAMNHRALGEHAEAVRLLRRMLRQDPMQVEGYLLLGYSYRALDRGRLADAVLRTYHLLEPVDARVARAQFRARMAASGGRPALAAELELARTYLETGQQAKARELLERLRHGEPDHPEVKAMLARAAGPSTLRVPPLPPDPEGDAA